MEQRIITTNISMSPTRMEEPRGPFLLDTLQKNKHRLHSPEDGYIIKIIKIISFTNVISPVTCNIIFTTKFLAESIILQKGVKLLSSVKMMLGTGLLCQFQDVKIWIPTGKTGGYRYDNGMYIKDDEEINLGDEVQVQLTEMRYEKKSFSCIAVLTS